MASDTITHNTAEAQAERTVAIIKRLRNPPFGTETSERNLMSAAADEIERLRTLEQGRFTNMVRSLFNIDGYLLPELTTEHQREFVREPVRYFMGTDKSQQDAIFREVLKRQARS